MVFKESSTDEELMKAYQDGADGAFDMLFYRNSSRVYGFLMSRLKNRVLADDVFQATFLKLHQSRRHYDPAFPFLPWLFTVCKSVLVDQVRNQNRILEDMDNDAVEMAKAREPNDIGLSAVALETLSSRERTAIELRYTDDLAFEEIALRLHTSPSNVRQIISRGIKSLKMRVGKKGE